MKQPNKLPLNILITGASSGIGRALALHYAGVNTKAGSKPRGESAQPGRQPGSGINLYLSGRDEKRLAEIAQLCQKHGARVESRQIDVRDRAAMTEWIQNCDDCPHAGPLDLIIANAGISGGTGGVMEGEPFEQARDIFDINLYGVLHTIEPIIPRMIQRKGGQIAIISSLAAFRGWPGAPAYSASKGAVRFLGEALRGVLGPSGVKVNVVCPGFVVSRMTDVNEYKMPFLMPADKAARIIAVGLQKNKGRIAFPFPTHALAWLISVLPDSLALKLQSRLPAKPQNT